MAPYNNNSNSNSNSNNNHPTNTPNQGESSIAAAATTEDDVLASLGTTRANTTTYESDVIRQATHQLAPVLTLMDEDGTGGTVVGFPDLLSTSILPFPVQGQAKANRQVVTQWLTKLQAQMQQSNNDTNSTSPEDICLLAMKQQMLLSMLGTHSKKASIQKCWQQQEQVEAIYRNITQSQSIAAPKKKARVPMQQRKQIQIPGAAKVAKLQQEENEKSSSKKRQKKWRDWSDSEDSSDEDDKDNTGLHEMNATRRHDRVQRSRENGAGKRRKGQSKNRKKAPATTAYGKSKTTHGRAALQKAAHQHLSGGRLTRRRTPVKSYAQDSDDENELMDDIANNRQEEETNTNVQDSGKAGQGDDAAVGDEKKDATLKEATSETSIADSTNVNQEEDTTTNKSHETEHEDGVSQPLSTVTCPLCQGMWEVSDPAQMDDELAKHMAQCQSGGRRTRHSDRRTRKPSVSVNYKETEEEIQDEEDDEETPPTRTRRRKRAVGTKVPARKQIKLEVDEENDFGLDDNLNNSEEVEEEEYVDGKLQDQEEDSIFDDNIDEDEELAAEPELSLPKAIDDYWLDDYEDRVDYWRLHGVEEMRDMSNLRAEGEIVPGSVTLPGGLHIPAWMNSRLFGYQRTGVEWMWQLHRQEAGGVIGDEMGLGKTVQVCSFLGAMASSRMVKGVLIISPATMLRHWLSELATWAPGLRRVLLHSSGDSNSSALDVPDRNTANQGPAIFRNLRKWLKKARRDKMYERIDHPDEDDEDKEEAADSFCGTGYAIISTYEHLRRNQDMYVNHPWSYVVMDEAQKIRNPVADITLACKRLRTPHRLAMTGTPIQNDLKELWSLFDFVFPGRLGTLPAFEQEFADPIKRGGYSNASPVQVQLAYRCSLILRDLIDPYLLRRQKSEVEEVNRMPGKTEHVLFCRLSKRQRRMYEAYLKSDTVSRIFKGSTLLFAAVTMLRKICNHPDLVVSDPSDAALESFVRNGCVPDNPIDSGEDDDDDCEDDTQIYDEDNLAERSGKFEVLAKILPLWKEQGHRVLIFCQWKKMLNIIQKFVHAQGWRFSRLDGNTSVASRQRLVDNFNSDPSIFGMLCTTRTGGVGLNLTGANRIILYDIDWNPQTDAQARERAWRFGQEREVVVYRLCTAGTIEEKMYQRQIFKTALTNKVLHDPRQRRLFSQKDLHDLLSLKPDNGRARAGGGDLVDTANRIAKADQSGGGGGYTSSFDAGVSKDDGETLRTVLKSKGLAGVFDHNFVDTSASTNKSGAVREMEEQAKRIAKEAAKALRESIITPEEEDPFTPTWTGEADKSRFGGGSSSARGGRARVASITAGVEGSNAGQKSSGSLLASLREKNAAVKTGGRRRPSVSGSDSGSAAASGKGSKYTKLMGHIRNYVKNKAPKTDELLDEFSSVPDEDAAIFRRLLNNVAKKGKNGRWFLQDEYL